MCGIAGTLHLDGAPADAEALRRMVRMLTHRGPDDAGVVVSGAAGLGHARLSIIDVDNGFQPMSSADGNLWITFNGEIFNYVELRQQLVQRGHRFATRSDTEVLLHLYQQYGPDCVHHLNGQWAFAIWDQAERRLFLSRDRLGVRPLFYTTAGSTFMFASEIKALFTNRDVDRSIDVEVLDQLFTFWTSIPPRTFFTGVNQLPPGHSLTVAGGRVATTCYWQLDYSEPVQTSEEQSVERLLELLNDATRIRLRSDVPVAAYLSGGLDSSVIAALAARWTAEPPRTFSIAFEDREFDESPYQREVAAYLHADHDEMRCRNTDIGEVFPDVVWHAEQPVLRAAPGPLFLLSERVRERGYKVVLTGEGADEILGGYDLFKEAKIRRFIDVYPQSRFRRQLLRRLYPYLPAVQAQPDAYLAAFFKPAPGDAGAPFFSHLPRWTLTSQLKRFYSPSLRARVGDYDARADLWSALPPQYGDWNDFARGQYLETAHLLPGYILASQGDRMAMGHGVEQRFPFLDHRVVEFGASLPPRLKMKVLNEKYILKRAARGLIPESVRRRPKQPYRAPDARSFFSQSGRSPDYVTALLAPERLREDGLFEPAAVSGLVSKVRAGKAGGVRDNMALVGILSTQLVVDQFIRSFARADHPERDPRVRHRELPLRGAEHPVGQ